MSPSLTHRCVCVGFVYVASTQSLVTFLGLTFMSVFRAWCRYALYTNSQTRTPCGSTLWLTAINHSLAESSKGHGRFSAQTPVTTEMDHSCTECHISVSTCTRGKLTCINNEKANRKIWWILINPTVANLCALVVLNKHTQALSWHAIKTDPIYSLNAWIWSYCGATYQCMSFWKT